MIAPLARFIDWYGLQFWWTIRLKSVHKWVANSKLEESLQFLNGPNFIPRESDAARIEFNGSLHFRFPTPRPSDLVENNTVYGRLYRCVSAYSQVPPTPAAPSPEAVPANFPPSVADVVKLARSGVGDDVVIAFIKNSASFYNLSANDILALRKGEISAPVIAAMLNHDNALRNQPPSPSYEPRLYAPANPPPAIRDAPAVPPAATVSSAPTFAAPGAASATNALPTPSPQPIPNTTAVVEQAPPPPQVELVPVAPDPDYAWVPGYWTWSGTWVWVGCRWAIRPWHGAAWVGGHWGRHGRGYIWIGGQWR